MRRGVFASPKSCAVSGLYCILVRSWSGEESDILCRLLSWLLFHVDYIRIELSIAANICKLHPDLELHGLLMEEDYGLNC